MPIVDVQRAALDPLRAFDGLAFPNYAKKNAKHNEGRAQEVRLTSTYNAKIRFVFETHEKTAIRVIVGEGEGQLFKANDLAQLASWLVREAVLLKENEA